MWLYILVKHLPDCLTRCVTLCRLINPHNFTKIRWKLYTLLDMSAYGMDGWSLLTRCFQFFVLLKYFNEVRERVLMLRGWILKRLFTLHNIKTWYALTYIHTWVTAVDTYDRWRYLWSSEVESMFRSASVISLVLLQCYNMRELTSPSYLLKSQLETPRIGAWILY